MPPDDPHPEIMANLVIFMTAFGPMRDWLNKGADPEVVLRTVAFSIAAMVERLAAEAGASAPAAESAPARPRAAPGA